MDDQNIPQEALNEEVTETETVEDTTPVSNETAGTVQAPEESKKGYSARVQELANAKKAAEEKAKSLEDKLAELTSQIGAPGSFNPYQPQNEPLVREGEELTAEELNKRQDAREQRLHQQIEFRLQQERAINRVNREAGEVVRIYPQLDPNSEYFDRELSKDVTEAAEEYIKANPQGSVKGFVTKMMKPIAKQVTKEVATETENIAKQVSQSAIRPSQSKAVEKKFEDMTIEEMEAQLGFVE